MADYDLIQIEEYFNEQRAQARWPYKRLDPTDWSFMDAWQKDGVPFAVICRGIEEVFTNHLRRNAPGKINTVRYCEDAIKKHWKNHGEAHVGSRDNLAQTGHEAEFGIAHLTNAIATWIAQLREREQLEIELAADQGASGAARFFLEVLQDTIAHLDTISAQVKQEQCNLATLDSDLLALEEALITATLNYFGDNAVAVLIAEAEKYHAQYKDKMLPGIWQDTVNKYVHKKLRETSGIPRLSLFYL